LRFCAFARKFSTPSRENANKKIRTMNENELAKVIVNACCNIHVMRHVKKTAHHQKIIMRVIKNHNLQFNFKY